jgi:hypothetical protein
MEFQNPGKDDLRNFLLEMLATKIQKGPVPSEYQEAVAPEALTDSVPEELQQITGGEAARLETFPFEPDAFEDFVEQIAAGDMSSKPSEALIRLMKAAQTAMKQNKRTIDRSIVDAIGQEGF